MNNVNYSEEMKDIIKEHPSPCYQCPNVRKPASIDLIKQGWCGCVLFARIEDEGGKDDIIEKIFGGELAEGWVNLQSYPKLEKSSPGIITNFQLLTKEIVSCNIIKKYF